MATNLKDRSESRVIEGITYHCWPLPFGAGRPLLVRAFKAVAPAFAAAIKGSGDGAAASALEAIAGSLDDADIARFASAFGDAAEYEDESGKVVPLVARNQDLHFAGRYDVFLQWLLFAMEVNGFARFFSTLKDEATSAPPPTNGSPPSP